MKGFLIVAGIIGALYLADQQYAQGKYTIAVGRMVTQMRHSFGVSGPPVGGLRAEIHLSGLRSPRRRCQAAV